MPLSLTEEQQRFDAQLASLLEAHAGEFALCKDGRILGFFPSYGDAYSAGLDRLGLDEDFLVAHVIVRHSQPASVSWQAGVMFDPDE